MKNILRLVSTCLIGAGMLVSCAGFLEEKPTTSLSEATVYSNEEVLDAQIYGIYAALHTSNMFLGTMYEFFQTGSGLLSWKGVRTTNEWLSNINFCKYSDCNDGNKSLFPQVFTAINRCNRLLDNLPGSPVRSDYKTKVEAEAKFVRAFLYFLAVRVWGDVPLMLSSPKSIKEVNNPRTAWYKVYCQIISDLEFAEANMPTLAETKATSSYAKGRPCNTAATALKASVYLTIASLLGSPDDNFWDSSKDADLIAAGKDPRTPDFSPIGISTPADAYQKAYDAADDVITSGNYSLVDNYFRLYTWGWRPAGETADLSDWQLPERIFVLQSTDMSGTNYYSVRSLPSKCPWTSNPSTSNSNWGRVRPDRFFINEFIRRTGGRKGVDATEFNTDFYIKTDDPRFDASFFHNYKEMASNQVATDDPAGTARKCYPHHTYDPDPEVTPITTQYNNTTYMPYTRKSADPTYDVTKGQADFYVIRYAEMFLIRAEAAANLSSGVGDDMWKQALDDIEVLHDRARKSYDPRTETGPRNAPFPSWASATFADKDELVNAIVWERFIELNFEGHEWFDTHRFGATWLRDNIAVPKNDFSELPSQIEVYKYIYKKARPHPEDIQDIRKGLLNAYPENELRNNSSLDAINDQNDFFWQ